MNNYYIRRLVVVVVVVVVVLQSAPHTISYQLAQVKHCWQADTTTEEIYVIK